MSCLSIYSQQTLCNQFGNNNFTLTLGTNVTVTTEIDENQQGVTFDGDNSVFIISGLNVSVEGDFVINFPIKFENCIIKFSENAELKVESQRKLILDNSKLFSCDGMWDGILLDYSSSIESSNQTEIEDASIAINAPYESYLDIKNTVFNRNRKGMLLGNLYDLPVLGYPTPLSPIFTTFRNNSFTLTSQLNSGLDDAYGIEIRRATTSIGNNNSLNIFSGLYWAIWIHSPEWYPMVQLQGFRFER